MKIFQNKSIFKKILIVLLVILVFNFCFSGRVEASKDSAVGGKLLEPICDLLVFIGDGIMNIIHKIIFYQEDSTIRVDTVNTILGWVLTIAVGIVAVAVIAATIHFGIPALIAAVTKLGWASFAAFLKGVGVGTIIKIAVGGGVVAAAVFNREILPDKIYFPVYQISPEDIVSNEILLFDVDFFNPKEDKLLTDKDGNPINREGKAVTNEDDYVYLESTAKLFRTIISNAYKALRNIALVSLLSILVYVGIRILLSSVSSDKAKYKKMLIDWIVAFCLLFFMQYVMSFSNLMIGKVTDILKTSKGEYTALIPEKNGKVEEVLKKMGYDVDEIKMDIDGETYFNWKTNSLGVARLNAQMAKTENASYAGYTIVFVVLVLITVYFIWTYLWRVCKMVFYTVFAPIISVIYPMKRQVATDWFKKYMSTLAIQPIHLLLCYILIYQNFELSSTNFIYYIVSIVAMASLGKAEKFFMSQFGAEDSAPKYAGAEGAALTTAVIGSVFKKRSSNSEKSKGKDGADEGKPKVRYNEPLNVIDSAFGSGGPLPGGSGNPLPGGSGNPLPGGSGNPLPGGSGNPLPGGSGNPLPGGSGNPLPRGSGNPLPGGSGNPLPGGSGNPLPGGSGNPLPRGSGNPLPGGSGNPLPGGSGSPLPGSPNYYRPSAISRAGTAFGTKVGTGLSYIKRPWDNLKSNIANNKRVIKFTNTPVARAISAGTRYYANGTKNKIKEVAQNAHPVKTIGGVAGGAAGAMLNMSLAVAAGKNFGEVTKDTLNGYDIGSNFVGNTMNTAQNVVSVPGTREVFEDAWYGEQESNRRRMEQEILQKQKDLQFRMQLEKELGDKQLAKNVVNNAVPEYMQYGFKDVKDIAALVKMERDGIDRQRAMSIASYVNDYGKNTDGLGAKDSKDLDDTLKNKARRNTALNQQQVDQVAQDTRDQMDLYSRYKYSQPIV